MTRTRTAATATFVVALVAAALFALLRSSTGNSAPAPGQDTQESRELTDSLIGRFPERDAPSEDRTSLGGGASPTTETPSGSIVGRLVDRRGNPVSPARIRVDSRDTERVRRTKVDAEGRFSFSRLAVGATFNLHVEEDSLPAGYIPPWRQDVSYPVRPAAIPAGFIGTEVTIPDGGVPVEVTLTALRGSTVFGRVLGPNREPIANAFVRLSCIQPQGLGVSADSTTDTEGRFEHSGVYPGVYRTQVHLVSILPQYQGMGLPVPTRLEILEGSITQSVVIQVGTGTKTVTGTVVDQDGAPFSGLKVLAYLNTY